MQVLNREDDTVQLNFRHIRELGDNIKLLLRSDKVLMLDKPPDTFMDYSPPEFEEVKDENQKIQDEVVKNIITGNKVPHPRNISYMSFPSTPEQIREQAKIREETDKRFSLAMQSYDEEFSIAEARRELLESIDKEDSEFAAGVISNLLENEIKKIKVDNESNVDEGKIAIFSRTDTAKNIPPKKKGKKGDPAEFN